MAGRTPGNGGAPKHQRTGPQPAARPARQPAPRTAKRPAAAAGRASSPASPKAGRPSAHASHAASARKGGGSPARRQASPSYNAPSLWTKDAPGTSSAGGPVRRVLGYAGRGLLSVLALAGRGAGWAACSLGALVRRSRAALAVTVLACSWQAARLTWG